VIPGSMGISIILGAICASFFLTVIGFIQPKIMNQYLLMATIIGIIGILDDFTYMNDGSKGFKGHIRNLIKGNLTTGTLKAIFGFIVAGVVSLLISTDFINIILNTMIISLTTNLLNILDTRPLRAIKGYGIIMIFILLTSGIISANYVIIGAIAAYLPIERNEQGMLGDSGSNFLGALAGMNLVIAYKNIYIRLFIFIVVFLLNLFSEKYSFSAIIENNSVLRTIDFLGRKKEQ
jgi:UDP-N-acetylmuramyl pentapeptide phosphotransferase/UDP-N-acetylglucosamine-1-phosphate transferase